MLSKRNEDLELKIKQKLPHIKNNYDDYRVWGLCYQPILEKKNKK